MTTPDITIPRKALEAAYNERDNCGTLEDICIAMIKAWPGMYRYPGTKIVLPLAQESPNDR